MKPITLTHHAQTVIRERGIKPIWVDAAVREPDWIEGDPQSGLERRFRVTPERGGRVLRVVCEETDDTIRVVTAFLDRRARSPK